MQDKAGGVGIMEATTKGFVIEINGTLYIALPIDSMLEIIRRKP
jgi:hypothetical protein